MTRKLSSKALHRTKEKAREKEKREGGRGGGDARTHAVASQAESACGAVGGANEIEDACVRVAPSFLVLLLCVIDALRVRPWWQRGTSLRLAAIAGGHVG